MSLKPCGTAAAYVRHLARGEEPCEACRKAEARRKAEWRRQHPAKNRTFRRRDNRRRRKFPRTDLVLSSQGPPSGMLTSADICTLAGITYRQLDYWVRTGRITPTISGDGSGYRRCWSLSDARRAVVLSTTWAVACRLARSVGLEPARATTLLDTKNRCCTTLLDM